MLSVARDEPDSSEERAGTLVGPPFCYAMAMRDEPTIPPGEDLTIPRPFEEPGVPPGSSAPRCYWPNYVRPEDFTDEGAEILRELGIATGD